MKKYSLFLLLCLTINSPVFAANSCSGLFGSGGSFAGQTKNASDVVLEVFSKILKAPNNSTIKIFTKNINGDGIGSMLLLLSVRESSLARGLKFEFYLEESGKRLRIHDLLIENSSTQVRFKETNENEFSNKTVVMIESQKGIDSIEFVGDLTSASLKDAAGKTVTPVNYNGRSILKASPFKNIDVYDTANITEFDPVNYNIPLKGSMDFRMDDADVRMISQKAEDLALQLYILKNSRVPKAHMSSLEMLGELIK